MNGAQAKIPDTENREHPSQAIAVFPVQRSPEIDSLTALVHRRARED